MTRYCLSRWCTGHQLKIHVLSTTQVGGLSFTEKSFHIVRASVTACPSISSLCSLHLYFCACSLLSNHKPAPILNTILRFSSVDAWQLLPRKESSFWPLQPIFLNCSLQRSLRYISLICSAAGSYFLYLLLHAYTSTLLTSDTLLFSCLNALALLVLLLLLTLLTLLHNCKLLSLIHI